MLAAFAGAATLSSFQPPASTTPPQEPARPTFRAGVNFVRVDVFPTRDDRIVSDLRQDEFEVLEDGVRQTVESFQFIKQVGNAALDTVVEPNTVRESQQLASDSSSRLFVLFFDTYHLHWESGYRARAAFLKLLGPVIGPNDIVAVMTPEMSAANLTFARRRATLEELLDRYLDTSRAGPMIGMDRQENLYLACYGEQPPAPEMIARRREKLTLDALRDLVVHVADVREERKTVFVVSEGWSMFRQNRDLARPIDDVVPGPSKIGTGPDGRLRVGDNTKENIGSNRYACDKDRLALAMEDHEIEYRRLIDVANRANTSFYSLDPTGLLADAGTGFAPPEAFPKRREPLINLSAATDGTSVMNTNDMAAGVRRIVDDVSAYYLLGYSSSNPKADGRFRTITVRVSRPSVRVRARRGYQAVTEEELRAARTAASVVEPSHETTSVAAAIDSLARIKRNAVVSVQAGYRWRIGADGKPMAVLWLNDELDAVLVSRDQTWMDGADVTIGLTMPDGQTVAGPHHVLTREDRMGSVDLSVPSPLPTGTYSIRVTTKPLEGSLGSTSTLSVTVPTAPAAGEMAASSATLFRRGPFSGSGWVPAGDLRFRRQERVRVDVAVVGATLSSSPRSPFQVRLLDRTGHELGLPVTVSEREADGARIGSGELVLAPLSPGDYILETSIERGSGEALKVLSPFRIVP